MAAVIAQVPDPITGEPAEIRKDARGQLYISGPLGVYKFQSIRGQQYMTDLLRKFSGGAANDGGSQDPTPPALRSTEERAKELWSIWKHPKKQEPTK
ncbi:hypothetical protein [Celerinatantimonas sp. YJH-8]|uniref:hypothetical protein n=1 Tax=Celerinatantimonas sp. YJH-8 TaxID=3228714 RepID=UPI0038BE2017